VATATDLVTGFAALAPAEDPDTAGDVAEVVAFEIDPAHRGTGHGSRLLNAVADTARDLGFRRLVLWSPERDESRVAFLRGAGATPDGARRVRAAGTTDGGDPSTVEWAEVRLVADLGPDPGPPPATHPAALR
jgi:GNAT superfamily N-acetyltransferase